MTIKTDSAPMSCILFVGTYCTFCVFEYDLAGQKIRDTDTLLLTTYDYFTTYDLVPGPHGRGKHDARDLWRNLCVSSRYPA